MSSSSSDNPASAAQPKETPKSRVTIEWGGVVDRHGMKAMLIAHASFLSDWETVSRFFSQNFYNNRLLTPRCLPPHPLQVMNLAHAAGVDAYIPSSRDRKPAM